MKNPHNMDNTRTGLPGVPLREQLWSPVQNTALWLGWWLHDVIAADDVIDAFHAVQGPRHEVIFAASAADVAPPRPVTSLVELMRLARAVTEGAGLTVEDRPLVSLALAGPGDVPPLPAGPAAAHVQQVGCGIVLSDALPSRSHVLVPELSAGTVLWTWHVTEGAIPPLPFYSPGEADEMLRNAVDNSRALVAGSGHVAGDGRRVDSMRLAVGTLADAFGLPGLPAGVATRAQRLLARADTVSAIIEVTRTTAVGAQLDAHLLPMLRAVRLARMVAVDFALRELLR